MLGHIVASSLAMGNIRASKAIAFMTLQPRKYLSVGMSPLMKRWSWVLGTPHQDTSQPLLPTPTSSALPEVIDHTKDFLSSPIHILPVHRPLPVLPPALGSLAPPTPNPSLVPIPDPQLVPFLEVEEDSPCL